MIRRTTIELDDDLLARAKRALGRTTTRDTVETALRIATDAAEQERTTKAKARMDYLANLHKWADLDVMRSEDMWR